MKKRIILITQSFPFGTGEASFISPELKVLKRYYDISIIARNISSPQTNELEDDIDVFRYDASAVSLRDCVRFIKEIFSVSVFTEILHNGFKWKNQVMLLKCVVRGAHFAAYAQNIRKNYSQPVMYYTYWNDYAALGICRLCHRTGDRCISKIHGGDLYKRISNNYYQPLKKMIATYIDRINFISEEGLQYFIENYHIEDTSNLVVQYMGVEGEKILNRGSNDGKIRILTLSNVIALKRIHLVVKALSMIDDIDISWTHIGDGELLPEIVSLAHEMLDTKPNISYQFKGRLSNEAVRAYFRESAVDLLINTSESEGLPVSMMEAASYGIPLVGTDVGGVSEIISNLNGYLLNKNFTPNELAETIRNFCKKSVYEKNEMRNNSWSVWANRFNAETNYTQFIEEIEKVWHIARKSADKNRKILRKYD